MHSFVKIILEQYYDKFNELSYSKGDVIFNEGMSCEEIAIVIKGGVTISTITYNENEETINVIKENEVFGDLLVFSSKHIYLGDAIANKKTTILLLPKNKLLSLLKNDNLLFEAYLNLISDRAITIRLQAKLFSHKKIEDRIMYYLSINQQNGKVFIPSVTNVAKELSLPRPSVSRSLTLLEKKNYIKRKEKYIYLNK